MKDLITTFYTAFQELDAEKMISCYHKDMTFEDPGFGKLDYDQACKMWRMLCNNASNFSLEFSQVEADEYKGSAHWEPKYNFSQTGRFVHNIIDASFEFKDGKIYKHVDHFDLHRWAGQALGWKGKLLGGTSFFKKKLQLKTKGLLARYS
ncbi:nuclear transport factor 2 family protein [Aquimarina rhabdastrellae]